MPISETDIDRIIKDIIDEKIEKDFKEYKDKEKLRSAFYYMVGVGIGTVKANEY